MAGYSLLGLLYGAVEVSLAKLTAVLISDSIQRQHFREVVLVAVLLLQRTIYIGLGTIEISIVFCVESMPEARA